VGSALATLHQRKAPLSRGWGHSSNAIILVVLLCFLLRVQQPDFFLLEPSFTTLYFSTDQSPGGHPTHELACPSFARRRFLVLFWAMKDEED
jgi:hypothetical protein